MLVAALQKIIKIIPEDEDTNLKHELEDYLESLGFQPPEGTMLFIQLVEEAMWIACGEKPQPYEIDWQNEMIEIWLEGVAKHYDFLINLGIIK